GLMFTEQAMSNLALKNDWSSDAELSTLAEGVEQAAWRDAMKAPPAWVLSACGIHSADIGDALMLVSCDSRSLMFNRVIGLGERTQASDEQITKIMERYWALGAKQYLVHSGAYARPMRLGRKLQEHGLSPYRRSWVKLIRPATQAPRPDTRVVVRDAQLADATHVASVVGPAFDLTQAEAEIFAHLIERPRWRIFVGELDGEIASVAGMFIEAGIAYLAFAATRAPMRGQGAQRALLYARIQAAIAAGCDYITTETGFPLTADEPSPSYHNMLWSGFRPLSIRDNYAPLGTRWEHGVSE
ncbi:MAG TPA: GNAT family N-acetyltransferase, partial [Steroidobacteraceae bacterium]|nr:GNAT family N-acetyltransferase [Steroidobacteraceae bacterium]